MPPHRCAASRISSFAFCVKDTKCFACQRYKQGAILEELVSYLLKISGNIFNVYRNIHTKTNEIDQFITLNDTGKLLAGLKMLPCRFESFLGECKNYRNKSDVTHIGKFYSLLMSTSIKTGILFTYHGVTGSGWNDGTGLIKKM